MGPDGKCDHFNRCEQAPDDYYIASSLSERLTAWKIIATHFHNQTLTRRNRDDED